MVIKSHSSPPPLNLFFFFYIRVQNLDKNKFTNLGQLNSNYIVQNSDFFGGKIKNLMEYLKIYHLWKWNRQNYLIIQQTCFKVTKVLLYTFFKENDFVKEIT